MTWTPDDLTRIGDATDFDLSVVIDDAYPKRTTVWVVRAGDDLYVRPYYGDRSRWYAAAQQDPRGRIHADGVPTDVTFEVVGDTAPNDAIDEAYRAKYGHGPEAVYVPPMVGPGPRATTVRLVPREERGRPDVRG